MVKDLMSPFTILSVVIFIGVLIFVHELGHFLVAKFFNIKVTKFSLGFGPPLLAFTRGETTYQIAVVPLGGYVRMVGEIPGEEIDEEDRERAFDRAPIYQRALVAVAGPAANLVFPIVCFFAYNLLEPEMPPAIVGEVEPGKPAAVGGMVPGDRVIAVDGKRVWSFSRLVDLIKARPQQTISVEVLRDGKRLALQVTPDAVPGRNIFYMPTMHGRISVFGQRDSAHVGIEDRRKLPLGLQALQSGDLIQKVGDLEVGFGEDLSYRFREVSASTVSVTAIRSYPLRAGDILSAREFESIEMEAYIPAGTEDLSDLGLGLGASFVADLVQGGAAQQAGFEKGDRIVAVEGAPVRHFGLLLSPIGSGDGRALTFDVIRNGKALRLELTPQAIRCDDGDSTALRDAFDAGFGTGSVVQDGASCLLLERSSVSFGASVPTPLEPVRLSIDEALVESVRETGQAIRLLSTYLFRLFVTREVSTDNLRGPLTFFTVAAQAAAAGLLIYLRMMAFISINLGLFNLLPVPVLDGGHLLLCLVEAVKRKPLSVQAKERAAMVGLLMLASLLILALKNDIKAMMRLL